MKLKIKAKKKKTLRDRIEEYIVENSKEGNPVTFEDLEKEFKDEIKGTERFYLNENTKYFVWDKVNYEFMKIIENLKNKKKVNPVPIAPEAYVRRPGKIETRKRISEISPKEDTWIPVVFFTKGVDVQNGALHYMKMLNVPKDRLKNVGENDFEKLYKVLNRAGCWDLINKVKSNRKKVLSFTIIKDEKDRLLTFKAGNSGKKSAGIGRYVEIADLNKYNFVAPRSAARDVLNRRFGITETKKLTTIKILNKETKELYKDHLVIFFEITLTKEQVQNLKPDSTFITDVNWIKSNKIKNVKNLDIWSRFYFNLKDDKKTMREEFKNANRKI